MGSSTFSVDWASSLKHPWLLVTNQVARGDRISVTSVLSVVNSVLMKHEELTGQIIGAAMAVLNELRPGLDEKLYENALVIELTAQGHTVSQQREYPFITESTSSASWCLT